MVRRVSAVIVFVIVCVALIVSARPVPYCETPYGIRDAGTCIAGDGYPYYHGTQVG